MPNMKVGLSMAIIKILFQEPYRAFDFLANRGMSSPLMIYPFRSGDTAGRAPTLPSGIQTARHQQRPRFSTRSPYPQWCQPYVSDSRKMSFNPEVLTKERKAACAAKKRDLHRYYRLVSSARIPLFGVQKASVYAKLETVALEELL